MSSWDEVLEAVGRSQQGLEGGTEALREQWAAADADDHAQRCVLAHYLADRGPELAHEVVWDEVWDEVALREHALLADDALAAIGMPSARAMAPSLHLNLGDGYLRQGRVEEARVQLDAGLAAVDAVDDDGYGALVRGGLERLAERLGSVTDHDVPTGLLTAFASPTAGSGSSAGDGEGDPHLRTVTDGGGELDPPALREDERTYDG